MNKYHPKKIEINIPIEIKTDSAELYFNIEEISIIHYPERPMPQCQDPSNPAYSDPGDPEENEFSCKDDVEFQIRERFNEIIEGLKIQLELVINDIDNINIHELLPKE